MASMTITNTRAVVDGVIKNCNLKIVDGKIKGIMPAGDTYGKTFDAKEQLVLPGFIDIHTHGATGVDFNSIDSAGLRTVRDFFASCGVTSFLPTVRTDSEEAMLRAILTIIKSKNSLPCPQVHGINLEGPFIASAWRGTMNEDYLQPCNYNLFKRLQDASGGNIKLTTISPELEGASQLIRRLSIEGVRVSLGHSGADYEAAEAAIEAGSLSCTHMFQSMSMLEPLRPSISSAMLESDCFCEVVCDPSVLHPAILRLLFKVKGAARLIAVTDSMMACGLTEGLYHLGTNDIVVRGGTASTLYGQSPVGNTVTANVALRHVIESTGLPLPKAITLFTENPARLLGIYHAKGSIGVGKDADFTVMDNNYNIIATFSHGEQIYGR